MLQHSRERQEQYFRNGRAQMPSFCSFTAQVLALQIRSQFHVFLLSWFVWYKRKDEYKNPEVSLTFLKKLQPGSSAFRGRETLEATDLRTTTGGRDMGQIIFFSLPAHESRALPSSNRKAQKALCGRLGDRAEEERAVQVTHRQVQVCSGTVPRQYDGSFPLIGFYCLSHTGSNPP